MPITISGSTGVAGVDGSASIPAVQGADANTGIMFGTDTVSIATGGTTRATVDSSGNMQFDSGYGSVATAYGCRAWVNFNGTGTVAIRGSGNVTSITDNGTGDYTVNFTSSMPDVNYSVAATMGSTVNASGWILAGNSASNPSFNTTNCKIVTTSGAGTLTDQPYVLASFHR